MQDIVVYGKWAKNEANVISFNIRCLFMTFSIFLLFDDK